LALAAMLHWGNWLAVGLQAGFFYFDWVLLALLPIMKRSFGPIFPTLVVLSLLRGPFCWLPTPFNWLAQICGTLLVGYGFWIEPFRVQISRQKLNLPGLRAGRPLRLLHLADLHLEQVTQREVEIQRVIEATQPDVICFSGDVLNLSNVRDPQAIQAARQLLSQWKAPLGVFAVSGSPAVDLPDVFPSIMDGLPLKWLNNEQVVITWGKSALRLVGITCTHKPQVDAPILQKLMEDNSDLPSVLLYHTPDIAPEAAQMGVDLQLSGHTHGGQVRLPFLGALFTGSLYGRVFQAGRMQLGRLTLYISRGLGMEGAGAPRVRFLCRPEIILWELGS
jgi:predicted MPP superfamily phosphohydrolase